MSSARQGYLVRWIPAILVVAFACDVAFHFIRIDFIAFRCDEMVSQGVPLGFTFEPGRHVQMDRASGDLAALANLPAYRVFRPQSMTIDRFGFRNAPEGATLPPRAVLLGSSFTIGTGNSDDQTLARRLQSLSGCSVYSAGGMNRVVSSARDLVRKVGMVQGLVLLEVLERDAWSKPIVPDVRKPRFRYSPIIWWYYDQARRSRLQIIAQRIYQSFCNDRFLPNTHKSLVAVRELEDGLPMLFVRDIEHSGPLPAIEPHIRGIEQLRDALRADGHRLVVYILPDKLTVYRDLLKWSVPEGDTGARVLAELERGLKTVGIPALNLEPILHEAARAAMANDELIYWPDDTHWNPLGIDVAARTINLAFNLPAACSHPPSND